MIGGTVIEAAVVRQPETGREVLRLWCVDKRNGDEGAVYTKPYYGSDIGLPIVPRVGDEIWWQGDTIYWSDPDRTWTDHPLPKIGYSFNPARGGERP